MGNEPSSCTRLGCNCQHFEPLESIANQAVKGATVGYLIGGVLGGLILVAAAPMTGGASLVVGGPLLEAAVVAEGVAAASAVTSSVIAGANAKNKMCRC